MAVFVEVDVSNGVQTISAYSVINDVIPKLDAVEKLVEGTVKEIIETSRIPAQVERYTKLQMEFQLELSMIRMKLPLSKESRSFIGVYKNCSSLIKAFK